MNGYDQPQPASAVFDRLRSDYRQRGLREADAHADPIAQFTTWLFEAVDARVAEPHAMILATSGVDGHPGARTVLLKDYDEHGLVFFTNYESRKGRELAFNPHAGLVFLWKEIERQVTFDGRVERVSREESDTYFHTRPLAAQLSAWASAQSRPLPDRAALDAAFASARESYAGRDVPLPPFWGGYRFVPDRVEFWQGRPDRLHDRLLYTREGNRWTIARLAP